MNKETDSVTHHRDRSAQMRDEFKDEESKLAQEEAQRVLHRAEEREKSIVEDERRVNDLIPPGTTRDQLLQRIREMRQAKVEEPRDYYVSPEQQAQLEAEQAEGRRAVAKAEAEAQRLSDLRMVAVAVEQASQGDMTPVHHPNPGQQEQYPAIKATLGKPASAPKQLK